MFNLAVFGLFAGLLFLYALFCYLSPEQNLKDLPPGPRGLPWIGIGFEAPTASSLDKYSRWGNQFGELCIHGNRLVAKQLYDRPHISFHNLWSFNYCTQLWRGCVGSSQPARSELRGSTI